MKAAAMVSLYQYPNWRESLNSLVKHVDHLVLRVDKQSTVDELDMLEWVVQADCVVDCFLSEFWSWTRYNWREEMLRRLDDVRPDVVLCPDEDEIFDTELLRELPEFMASDKSAMMFPYHAPLPTLDGAVLFGGKPYPGKPHMKAFKWTDGLTYLGYQGFARITNYADPACHWLARTEIWHFMGWTPELRQSHEMKW